LSLDVDLSEVDRARLSLVGAGVALSCFAAAGNLALATTWLTAAQPLWITVTCAIAAGLAGISLVLVYDRGLITSVDQGSPGTRMVWLWVIRALLILTLAASTLLKVAPSILNQELSQVSQQMQEGSDTRRNADLTQRYGVPALVASEDAAHGRVAQLRAELLIVPAPIAEALAAAERCRADVERARRNLLAAGIRRADARRRLAGQAARCADDRRAATAMLERHRDSLQAELTDASARSTELTENRRTAEAEVSGRLSAGRAGDEASLTAGNLEVLAEAARRNQLVLVQLVALYLIIVFGDGAGLLLKSALGRTESGAGLGTRRAIAFADADARIEIGVRQARGRVETDAAFGAAMRDEINSPEAREAVKRANIRFAVAVAPLTACAMAAAEIEDVAEKVGRTIRRRPDMGELLGQLLDEAVAQASRDFARAAT
jgi:hypothetical protein